MILDEVRRLLADRRLDKVADATGLSRETVRQIRDGVNTNPTLATLQKLYDYLKDRSLRLD